MLDLLSHNDIPRKICALKRCGAYSVKFSKEILLGNRESIDFSQIPKADLIISCPLGLTSFAPEIQTQKTQFAGFITEFQELVSNLIKFYSEFSRKLKHNGYLILLAELVHLDGNLYHFPASLSNLREIFTMKDEKILIYENLPTPDESKINYDNPFCQIQHLHALIFRNENLSSQYKSIDSFF